MALKNVRRAATKRSPEVLKAGQAFLKARQQANVVGEKLEKRKENAFNALNSHKEALRSFKAVFDEVHPKNPRAAEHDTAGAEAMLRYLDIVRTGGVIGNPKLMKAAAGVVRTEDAVGKATKEFKRAQSMHNTAKDERDVAKAAFGTKRILYGQK